MNEQAENQDYQAYVGTVLKQDPNLFCPMRREKQMDYLFEKLRAEFQQKNQRVLDACCGYGRLIHFLQDFDPEQQYVGIDYTPALIEQAQQRFADYDNIRFAVGDVMTLADQYDREFDISINYKTLYCLPHYETLVTQLVNVTKRKIYITCPFYEGNYDFIIKVYNFNAGEDIYSHYNTYSFPRFEQFCRSLGVQAVNATPMTLDFDLPKPDHPNNLCTWTERLENGDRLEVTGPVILNWKLVELVL